MNLTWHLAVKDVRRLWLPSLLWALFVLFGAVLWHQAARRMLVGVERWAELLQVWSAVLIAVQTCMALLLVGALALEDPVAGPHRAWATRPVARGRLLAAKVLAAVLLFVVSPLILLVAMWSWPGIALRELGSLVGEFARTQSVLIVFALLAAALVRNLGGFLAAVLLLVALQAAGGALGILVAADDEVAREVRQSRRLITEWTMVAGGCLVLAHQYLTRRTVRSWGLLLLVALLPAALAAGWQWGFTPAPRVNPTEVRAVALAGEQGSIFASGERPSDRGPTLNVSLFQESGEFVRPIAGEALLWWPGEEPVPLLFGAAEAVVPESVVRAVFGAQSEATSHVLRLWARTRDVRLPGTPVAVRGSIVVHVYLPRVLGALPIEAGSALRSGATQVRVREIIADDGTGMPGSVLLEEYDIYRGGPDIGNVPLRTPPPGGPLDVYVLRDASGALSAPLPAEDLGAARHVGRTVRARRLRLPAELSRDEWERGQLVRIRFERVREERRPLRGDDVPVLGDPS